MLVESHAETGDERKAAAAPLPHTIGNVRTAASSATLRRATCISAQVTLDDPRSRVHAGGFGMLWLTALTFALGKQAQAAEPNVTLLDDGNITYKDLEHGAFELITKEVIPRRFLVEDPGQTIILRSQGSSISVSQATNSAARMAELQAAQQEALAIFEKGLGSTGSSTPPPLERLPVEPINFIQIDNSSPERELPALPGSILAPVPETIFGKLPPPPPTPPTLNAVIGPTEIDTTVFDLFTATSGTFLASSPNSGATLTFGISGGTAGSTVIDGVTYDVSRAGPYGTLYVDSTTGAYTFVPDNDAINALIEPTATDFTITVSDGTLSAAQPFTIAINGTNDAAVISGATNGTAIEASGVANAALGALSASGTLTSTDVDDAPNTFAAVGTPTESARGFGTFTMTTAGVWTYTVNDANSAVQALNVGDKLTDSFTVTTIDGTPQTVTVTINGTNDAAVISGATTGSVTEDGGTKCDPPTATGTLTATDVDNAPGFTAVNCPTASDAGYGTFTMTSDGVWTYTLDDGNCAVQALNVGDKLIDCFTVTTIDGTPQVVKITINGANDAAVICGATTGSVTEAGACTYGTPIATGALTDTDVDNTPNTFTAVCAPKASESGYGTFTMTADGVWTYTLDNANCEVQALNDCDTLTDCFKVTTIDGTAQVVTITINGADDTFHFKDEISDVRTSDVIDLAEDIPASISSAENAAATSAPPAISEAAQPIELSAQWWNQPGNAVTTHATHDLIV
ncbi:VCBS domain-containing protein [Bradyrhizobium sp. AZCC 1693]|uniref:VCBS domain-containing protein n=1 Tax=Bradyrhizobium sp. AZCC 1693 TaxID=3117029 RepID=UPI002FF231E7